MGDRVWVKLMIGGEIAAEDLQELVEACEVEGGRDYYSDTEITVESVTAAVARGETFDVAIQEANYAEAEAIEDFCRERKLPYLKEWEAGGGFGPGIVVFDGASDPVEYSAISGDAVMNETQARSLGTFEAVMAWFSAANWSPPALTIKG